MQQRAGLLFLSKSTGRVLLILEKSKWTVPTFLKKNALLTDVEHLFKEFQKGKIIPIELYLSQDKGFEYGTYICIVDNDFILRSQQTFCWCHLDMLPKNLHTGLSFTLNNSIIRTKIETILEVANATNEI